MARTDIAIEEDLVREVMRRFGLATKRESHRSGPAPARRLTALIAAVALRTGARLVRRDADLGVLASVVPLDAVSLR